jgi:hypothetical protein
MYLFSLKKLFSRTRTVFLFYEEGQFFFSIEKLLKKKYRAGDKIEKNEMGGERRVHGFGGET